MARSLRHRLLLLVSASILVLLGVVNGLAVDATSAAVVGVEGTSPEAAGRYLVVVGGCNDCHTPGYAAGAVPESEWLVGSPVGFRGPWGTSYASNLRLAADALTEDEWAARLHGSGLPPMPWAATAALTEADARAVHRYLRTLGPAGAPAPRAVPPGAEPATPYVDFSPQHLERLAVAAE
jgi:mono/diheme cytochrome c family protein